MPEYTTFSTLENHYDDDETAPMRELKQAKLFLSAHLSPEDAVLVAVSGGLDSMCLLHFAAAQGLCVTAAHFNHQLRGERADRDEAFVRDFCAERQIPFASGTGDTRRVAAEQGLSLEEAARNLRYAFLEETAVQRRCRWILTAHHGDDNGETLLFNLLRGTGLKGLAGIPPVRGNILRPFLQIPRAELAQYAAERSLPYREDETNALDDASRNLLRHKVFPVLKELNPRAVEHMIQTMECLAEDETALAAQAAALMARARPIPRGVSLARADLQAVFPALQKRAILGLAAKLCGHSQNFSADHAEAMLRLVDSENPGTVVSLPYGVTARFCKGTLQLTQETSPPEDVPIAPGQTVSFGEWTVTLSADGGDWRLSAAKLTQPLSVTAWRSEDRLTLPNAKGSRSLKRLCVDAGLSIARREALAVLRMGDIPVAAAKIGQNSCFTPDGNEPAVFVKFRWNAKIEESSHD